MPDPNHCLKEQDKIDAKLQTARRLQVFHIDKHGAPLPSLASQIDQLEKDWWKWEDLLTSHGEKPQ